MSRLMGGFYTSVLLGEQSASKTDAWGSNPHACAAAIAANCRRGSTEKGVRLAVFYFFGGRIMLVRIQSSALSRTQRPDSVVDRIEPSEGSGSGSNPGRDTRENRCPASVEDA